VKKIKIIVGLAVFALIASTGWQIAACEIANYELKDELKDVASMGGSRIGLAGPGSDDELRDEVIQRAATHDILLEADQIEVERSGTREAPVVFLTAKYQVRIWMPGLALIVHYTATSG
jgi:hypothetical protein